MILWRLATAPFAELTGEGARLYGGRWNSPGHPVVYTAQDPALAVLETRVHLDLPLALLPDNYVLIEIDAGNLTCEPISLPSDLAQCQSIGDQWIAQRRSPLLSVPSVIIPASFNVLINPRHPDAAAVSVRTVTPFRFDPRLWELR